MKNIDVKIKLLEGGKMPEYGTDGAACADCYVNLAADEINIPPMSSALIGLGFALEIPEGYEVVIDGVAFVHGEQDTKFDENMALYETEFNGWKTLYATRDAQFTTEESVKMPNTYPSRHDSWNSNGVTNLWSEEGKTIYDPCPAGYRVPNSDAFRGFSKTGFNVDRLSYFNYVGSYDQGFNFIYDGVQTAWYPNTYRIDIYGEPSVDNYTNRLWQ